MPIESADPNDWAPVLIEIIEHARTRIADTATRKEHST